MKYHKKLLITFSCILGTLVLSNCGAVKTPQEIIENYSQENDNIEAINFLSKNKQLFHEKIKDCPNVAFFFLQTNNKTLLNYTLQQPEFNVELNKTDKEGNTLLHYLVTKKETEIIENINKELTELNIQNIKGQTPLILAIQGEDTKTIAKLLELGANPNICDLEETSPLHYAAAANNENATKELLSHGAKPNAVSKYGTTPLDVTYNSVLIESLRRYGGRYRREIENIPNVQIKTDNN
jgi:ankyrin repeat protein